MRHHMIKFDKFDLFYIEMLDWDDERKYPADPKFPGRDSVSLYIYPDCVNWCVFDFDDQLKYVSLFF
jgi:hypothetical protein